MSQDHDLLIGVKKDTEHLIKLVDQQNKAIFNLDTKIVKGLEKVNLNCENKSKRKLPKWVFILVLSILLSGFGTITGFIMNEVKANTNRVSQLESMFLYVKYIKERLDNLHK